MPEGACDLEVEADVQAASMAASGAGGSQPDGALLGPGDEVRPTEHHLGVRRRLTSWITEDDRSVRSVDEQVRGPLLPAHLRRASAGARVRALAGAS
ncbi:hypothetical protein ACWKWC_07205 [Geodermatophilus nigrescens]